MNQQQPPPGRKVEISRVKLPQAVECEGCDILRSDATRERARQHAKTTGHTVRVSVEQVTVYRPTEGGDR